jgi:putative hydrolase of the HAD superfamily
MNRGCKDVPIGRPSLPDQLRSIVGVSLPRPARAVLFDVYGTLFSSSSGEVGAVAERATTEHLRAAWEASDLGRLDVTTADRLQRLFYNVIREEHARLRRRTDGAAPYPHPEVDVRRVWKRVIAESGALDDPGDEAQIEVLAACYEASVNPVAPMPDARWAIEELAALMPLGLVSNAQFYTRALFPACMGASLDELGFDPAACAFSYEHLRAKPDPLLFGGPLAYLRESGIDSTEVLYVGNDMRNDVSTARNAGCMTALFAGDERSLRVRKDDPMTHGIMPTTVVRSLRSLVGIVTPKKESS